MQKQSLRIFPMILVLCLLFGCSSEKKDVSSDNPSSSSASSGSSASGEISLAFVENDSLSPYEAKTKSNQELAGLVYDGLIKLDENFEPVYVLADKISFSGSSCTVQIKSGARFTDGTPVTAEDAEYSLAKAREATELKYAAGLAHVSSVSASGSTLTITLAHEDAYFVNLLDFPIFKKGTDSRQNSDKKSVPPVGSGRYEFFADGGEYHLEANADWIGGNVGIARIRLVNLPDADAVAHAISVGKIDVYYSDLSDNAFPSMKGTSVPVVTSNLVYLGASSSGIMKNQNIRQAVSLAIDRSDVVSSVYFESATAAKGPYHSHIKSVAGLQTIADRKNIDAALESLSLSGYHNKDGDGYYTNNAGRIRLKIIYYAGSNAKKLLADKLVAYLKAVGIEAVPEGLEWDVYQSYIKNGYYDLYIGEIKIPANLDIFSLITAGGLLSGKPVNSDAPAVSEAPSETADSEPAEADADTVSSEPAAENGIAAELAISNFHEGKGSITEVLSCLNEQLPVIPICHRSGVVIYSSRISGGLTPVAGDPFYGIENCKIS